MFCTRKFFTTVKESSKFKTHLRVACCGYPHRTSFEWEVNSHIRCVRSRFRLTWWGTTRDRHWCERTAPERSDTRMLLLLLSAGYWRPERRAGRAGCGAQGTGRGCAYCRSPSRSIRWPWKFQPSCQPVAARRSARRSYLRPRRSERPPHTTISH